MHVGGTLPGLRPPAALGSGPAWAFSPFSYSALYYILPCSSQHARIPFSVVSEPVYYRAILTARPFDFFHMFVSTFPCPPFQSSPGTSNTKEQVVFAAELPEVVGARQSVRGVRMCSYRLTGSTVHGNSFWKRATATARTKVSVFV